MIIIFTTLYAILQSISANLVIALFGSTIGATGGAVYASLQRTSACISGPLIIGAILGGVIALVCYNYSF